MSWGKITRKCCRLFNTVPTVSLDTKNILYRRYNPVVLIGINNPDSKNALNEDCVKDLKEALTRFENDEGALTGVIFGEGGNFCSGYDLKELATCIDNPPKHFTQNDLTNQYITKPLIAAVNGYAVGVGFDLALMCDIRIMEESAIFGYYNRRFGMSVSEFGIERLVSMVGFSKAMDLIITGRAIKSEEALNIGLANRVVESGTAVGKALGLANDIAKFPQASIVTDRANLYKHGMPIFSQKFSKVETDTKIHKEKIQDDIKQGSKLFANGAGKKGQLFSMYLWDKI